MSLPVADCHNDLLLSVRHQRERGLSDPFGDFWLPQLKEGKVQLQVLPVCTEEQFVGEGALRRSMLLIEEARHLAHVHSSDVAIVETAQQLDTAITDGKIALLLALEGAEPVGHSVELIDTFWRAGIRMTSLSWNRRTMMADGVAETDSGGRLTQLGVDSIARMEELGVVVDVSHLSRAGFYHLADIATRPFIASHSSCDAVHRHPRNIDDQQLSAFARTGSLLCLNAFGPFLAEQPDIESFFLHIQHALSRLGPSLVALGTDFIVDIANTIDPVFTGLLVPKKKISHTLNLQRPGDFAFFTERLRDRFGIEIARSVAADNLIGFLRRALP